MSSFAAIQEVYGNEFGIEEQDPRLRINTRHHTPVGAAEHTTVQPSKFPGYLTHDTPHVGSKALDDYSSTTETPASDHAPVTEAEANFHLTHETKSGCGTYLKHIHNCPQCKNNLGLAQGGTVEGFGSNESDLILLALVALVMYYMLFMKK